MNIFLVQSPLQVLSAFEARCSFSITDCLLVVMLAPSKQENNRQLLLAVEKTNWPKVIFIATSGLFGNLSKKIKLTKLQYESASAGVQKLFIGDFRSLWMNRFRGRVTPEETWLLDDGSVTAFVQRDWFNAGIWWPPTRKRENPLKTLANYSAGKLQCERTPIHVFSAFDIGQPAPAQKIVRHQWESLRVMTRRKLTETGTTYFFGTKLSESGMISHEYEINAVLAVAAWHGERHIRFRYIPHRQDEKRKLDALLSAGIEIQSLGMPAELYFATANQMPDGIATFCSSAMNNLISMYDFARCDAFILPDQQLRPDVRASVALVYQGFNQRGIALHDIEQLTHKGLTAQHQ